MNAFTFGQVVREKLAAGPLTAEAPMTNPAQAAATNRFLTEPGSRNYLANMARTGQALQKGTNQFAAAAPLVGGVAGRVAGGALGGMLGQLGGSAAAQQARHLGADIAAGFGARPIDKPIPYGVRDWRLTNQPSAHAKEMNDSSRETVKMLDAIGRPSPAAGVAPR